jgi:peptidoglycan/xylan/chitin deacetylase (PgdA/CDA1 family)
MYHRVGESRNSWEARYAIRAAAFASHMAALHAAGYQAIPIDDLVSWLEGTGAEPPAGAFLLTFDDGFRGVMEYALPVLETMNWPFTVFLVSNLIGGQDIWTRDSNPSGQTYPLLTLDEIRGMQAQGCAFHSHTCSHASLPSLSDDELAAQLTDSRATLAQLLERPIEYLAYPFGHLDERVEAATRAAGYRAAFSTQPGFNRKEVNRFRIRRLDVFGTDTSAMLLRKLRFGSNDGGLLHTARYYLDRVGSRIPGRSRS